LINLANSSGYLVFASGGWYVDTAGCFLQGDVGTKVKIPGAGKNMVGEALQAPSMERLCKLHYFQSRVHAWSPTLTQMLVFIDFAFCLK
jgi:hypothetical protein